MKRFPQQHQGEDYGSYPEQQQKTALYTLAAVAVLASGFSAVSQYNNGQAIKGINNRNAAQAEQDALTAQRDAAIQANQQRDQNQRVLAKQRAAFAANGVVGDTGSPLIVEVDTAGYLERGALEDERQGTITSSKLRQQAILDRLQGSAAASAATLNATSTALSGASRAISTYKGI